MKFISLCTALLLLTSCVSWHIKGEDSPVAGPNPLASYNMRFRINRLNLQAGGADLYQQNLNMLTQSKVTQAAIKDKLYEKYPEFFREHPTSFPIDIDISMNQEHNSHLGYFFLYMCTLSLIPAKQSIDLDSSISIYPANPKHAAMFNMKKEHNTHMDQFMSVYFPTALFWGKKAVGENEANSHSIGVPKQLKDIYLRTICKALVERLSHLKVNTVEPVKVKHQIVEGL
ncbi:MAG: hypothetical protein HRT88_03445 [Lentisphaeraceae bacterium]|nr:hypothetical protein [Lentisphaeraceae bacterium]